jgi:hypothetical protein
MALAARRSLPIPTATDLATLGDSVTLVEALQQWERLHRPVVATPRGGFELPPRPIARWRTPFALKVAGVAIAGLLGFFVGEQVLLPHSDARALGGSVEHPWIMVNDSVTEALNETLFRSRAANASEELSLTAADLAALVFRSPRRRVVVVDSVEARADSLLAVRGQLAGKSAFELQGTLRVLRRGIGELEVKSLVVDGVAIDPTLSTRLLARGRPRTENSDRLRFDIPLNVTSLSLFAGEVRVSRDQYRGGAPVNRR